MRLFPLVAMVLVACGGSTAAPVAPTPASDSPAADTTSPTPSASSASAGYALLPFPTACVDKSADVCTPSSAFVDRLCNKPHQDIALALFASGTPFSRMYLRGKMDELGWDEEVLALRYHGVPKGGIQVGSGSGSYDVLRWDGSCSAAVDADMISKNKPPRPKAAHLQWHRLSDAAQSALIAGSDAVKRAHAKRGKECQGAMTGDVSASCEKADALLVDAVVEYVRGGGSVPPPPGL